MIARYLATALGLAAATWLLPGIQMPDGSLADKALVIAVVALILTVVNALAKPVLTLLSLPLLLLTLGLFYFVIHAAMLLITSWLAGVLGIGWHVDGLLNALIGSLIVSLVAMVAVKLFGDDKKERR